MDKESKVHKVSSSSNDTRIRTISLRVISARELCSSSQGEILARIRSDKLSQVYLLTLSLNFEQSM